MEPAPPSIGLVLPTPVGEHNKIGFLRASLRDIEQSLSPQPSGSSPSPAEPSPVSNQSPILLDANSQESVEVSTWASRIRLIDGTMNPSQNGGGRVPPQSQVFGRQDVPKAGSGSTQAITSPLVS